MQFHPFADRRAAGRALGERLRKLGYADRSDVLVLGLPRGGVPVAYEVAAALNAPLDVFVVRKLGTPGHEELAMGAIASGGVRVLNHDVIESLRIPQTVVDRIAREEQEELDRRERSYRGHRPRAQPHGRVAILVDDGLATGASMRAAVAALSQQRPARIVVAVPVGAGDSCRQMQQEVDEALCLTMPEFFQAVGQWYEEFSQTSDAEVRELLAQAVSPLPGSPEGDAIPAPGI